MHAPDCKHHGFALRHRLCFLVLAGSLCFAGCVVEQAQQPEDQPDANMPTAPTDPQEPDPIDGEPDPIADIDGDGIPDSKDTDNDNDGIPDDDDVAPLDPSDGQNYAPILSSNFGTSVTYPYERWCEPGETMFGLYSANDLNPTQSTPEVTLITDCPDQFAADSGFIIGSCAVASCTVQLTASDGWTTTYGTPITVTAKNLRFAAPVSRGRGDGSNWPNTTTDLTLAANAITHYGKGFSQGQLWLQQGTYYADPTTDLSLLNLTHGGSLTIVGGFMGTETSAAGRTFAAAASTAPIDRDALTVLDGQDRLEHVLMFEGDALHLKDLMITGGYASGVTPYDGYGAGIHSFGHLVFEGTVAQNSAKFQGGGIYHRGRLDFYGQATSNSVTSPTGKGGGLYLEYSGSTTSQIIHQGAYIAQNTASQGGGMFLVCQTDAACLLDGTIEQNTASISGGGMYISIIGSGTVQLPDFGLGNTPENCAGDCP